MGERHTLVHQLIEWAEQAPDKGAIFDRGPDGRWREHTWRTYYQVVRDVAKGLIALGHQPGDCVAIVGRNRTEWVICQLGIMAAQGIPAPIYTTNTVAQTAYIVSHSRAKIAICDEQEQLDKYLAAQADGSIQVLQIVTMDAIDGQAEPVMSLAQVVELGRQQPDDELDARIARIDPAETCLLIYTSGTTGVPKAVELTHTEMRLVAESTLKRFAHVRHDYVVVSYLPLCHVAEQLFTTMLFLETGGAAYFCPDLTQLKDYLVDVRPTVFLGVPRVWEKFESALRAKLDEASGLKGAIAKWAMKTELACFKEQVRTAKVVMPMSRVVARKIFVSKIQEKLGLDRLMVAATGAAPISISTQEFFASLGVCIHEGYGMSETSGLATTTDPKRPIFGTVGKPLDGVELRVADDGEVLLRGKNMTRSYLHMPEETRELIDDDGWLHTGDLGEIDSDGNLRITGRKKDLLITAGGKNVAPVELEAYLRDIPGVGLAVVVGDRKPYLSTLLVLDAEHLGDLCQRLGITDGSIAAVAKSPEVRRFFEVQIESCCNAKVARYQMIKKFEILPVEFSVDGGELTPTMKLKRNVIGEKYADLIAGMYA